MSLLTILALLLGGALVGTLIGYLVRQQIAQSRANSAEIRSEKILAEAKNKEQEILLQAKEKANKVLDDVKKEEQIEQAAVVQEQETSTNDVSTVSRTDKPVSSWKFESFGGMGRNIFWGIGRWWRKWALM